MGLRTRKMTSSTVIIVACYWLVAGIETADLVAIDIVTTATASLHPVVSTVGVIAIASILSLSYAVVTLCSFISPTDTSATNSSRSRRPLLTFDALYRAVVGAAGILFAEIPLLVVRSRVIAASNESSNFRPLPVVFYIWLIKDSVFIVIAMVMLVMSMVRVRRKTEVLSCNACGRMAFDNPDVFFAPEKRDTYIAQQQGLTGAGVCRDHVGESQALMEDQKTKPASDASASGRKKSKKSVTFRLDVTEGCSSRRDNDVCRSTVDDSDSDDETDTKL